MALLPVNIDTTYPDDTSDPTIRTHQQHHDAIHTIVNYVPGPVFNVRTFGAVGDGVVDDSGPIKAAEAALTAAGRGTIYFPVSFDGKGLYRFANAAPGGGAAVHLNRLSNVAVVFEPGAELYMDNLAGSSGSGHGIYVRGSGTNITLVNPVVRWKNMPARSYGDGIRFLGYPSDSAAPGGFTGSTGKLSNITVINSRVTQSPQSGMIFLGCSDVSVVNHVSQSTAADGLHFNACRRTSVLGYQGLSTGDDALAYVTYYDASVVYTDAVNGPFNQPSVGAWSNDQSTAVGVVVKSAAANGLRLGGARGVVVSGLSVQSVAAIGIVLDAGPVGGGNQWAQQACVGCSVDNAVIENVSGYGIGVSTYNATFASASGFWQFDVAFSNITIRNAAQPAVVTGLGGVGAGVAGLTFNAIRVVTTTAGLGPLFGGLRDSAISDLFVDGGDVYINGATAVDTSALGGRARNNLRLSGLTVIGGLLQLQDVRGVTLDVAHISRSPGTALAMYRCIDVEIGLLDIDLPNRAAGASVNATVFSPVQRTRISRFTINHDASGSGMLPFVVGGGDATNVTSDFRMEGGVYRNTYNQAILGAAAQGGAFGPVEWVFDFEFYNGGEGSPVWRRDRSGSTTWAEDFYGAGVPAFAAALGSTYHRRDGGAGSSFYVKETAFASTTWAAK